MQGSKRSSNPEDKTRDPLGLEPLLAIISIAVNALGVVHQFGLLSRRHVGVRRSMRRLRDEVLRLHNSLDDLILTLQRYSHYEGLQLGEGAPISEHRLSLTATVLVLRDNDYIRWRDSQDKIHALGHSVYELVAQIRQAAYEVEYEEVVETLDVAVLQPMDELLLGFGHLTLGEFVAALRGVIKALESAIGDLIKGEG